MNTLLQSMSESDYADWWQIGVRDFAEDKIANGTWIKEEAVGKSESTFRELLPVGLETEGQYLFTIRQQDTGGRVGFLWFGRHEQQAYVYDLYVFPEHRRHGHARAAMTLLEQEAARRGFSEIGLHVFGQNAAARDLYAQLGYGVTDLTMRKKIPTSDCR